MIDTKLLIREALSAKKTAYCKYSGFAVGAALLCKNGTIYRGCNIENASYTPTNCAERTAFFKAVSEGVKEFEAIAIVGGMMNDKIKDYVYPCGVCRQVMTEFCNLETFRIIIAKTESDYQEFILKEMLPYSFHLTEKEEKDA